MFGYVCEGAFAGCMHMKGQDEVVLDCSCAFSGKHRASRFLFWGCSSTLHSALSITSANRLKYRRSWIPPLEIKCVEQENGHTRNSGLLIDGSGLMNLISILTSSTLWFARAKSATSQVQSASDHLCDHEKTLPPSTKRTSSFQTPSPRRHESDPNTVWYLRTGRIVCGSCKVKKLS